MKEDYQKMKSTLLHKYGNIEILTDQILVPLEGLDKPTANSDHRTKLVYYCKLQSSFQKINGLLINPAVPKQESETFMYSHTFLKGLLIFLPEQALSCFLETMSSSNLGILRIQGMFAFKVLLSTVVKFYEKTSFLFRMTSKNSQTDVKMIDQSECVQEEFSG